MLVMLVFEMVGLLAASVSLEGMVIFMIVRKQEAALDPGRLENSVAKGSHFEGLILDLLN